MSNDDRIEMWRLETEHYLAVRNLSANSREAYRVVVRHFVRWCQSKGHDPYALGPSDIVEFVDHRKALGKADSSIRRALSFLGSFYTWLKEKGRVEVNPAADISFQQGPVESKRMATIDQIRALWSASHSSRQKAIVGLLAINGMRVDQIVAARFSDLTVIDGRYVLAIRGAGRRAVNSQTILAPEVHAAILDQANGRDAGFLFVSYQRNQFRPANVQGIVKRTAERAGLPKWVTAVALSGAIRKAAVDYGFSYTSTIREIGWVQTRYMPGLVETSTLPMAHRASVFMADLVLPKKDPWAQFDRARSLIVEATNPAALGAMLTGATLEATLRDAVRECGNEVNIDKAKISTYGEKLRERGIISGPDQNLLKKLEQIRNEACHGWFEDVTKERALWLLGEAESFARKVEHNLEKELDED